MAERIPFELYFSQRLPRSVVATLLPRPALDLENPTTSAAAAAGTEAPASWLAAGNRNCGGHSILTAVKVYRFGTFTIANLFMHHGVGDVLVAARVLDDVDLSGFLE
jgi:hypothetical protein